MRAGGRFAGGRFAESRLSRSRFSGRVAFDIASLFANGEAGDSFIPERDFCYTKTAGGVYEPVTTTGDEVARLTGVVNGINADQDVVDSRPVYMEGGGLSWLAFDGVDDYLVIPSPSLGMHPLHMWAGIDSPSRASGKNERILSVGVDDFTSNSRFALDLRYSTSDEGVEIIVRNNVSVQTTSSAVGNVVAEALIEDDGVTAFVNGSSQGKTSATPDATTSGNLSIGAHDRGPHTDFFTGKLYCAILRSAYTPEVNKVRDYVARKSGVTL